MRYILASVKGGSSDAHPATAQHGHIAVSGAREHMRIDFSNAWLFHYATLPFFSPNNSGSLKNSSVSFEW